MRLGMWFAIAAGLGLLVSGGGSVAQETRITRLEVIDAGFYTARRTEQTRPAPGTVTGVDRTIANVEFLDKPPEDSAKLGTSFGVRFRSVGRPRDKEVTLRSIWKIPAPGITNPKTNNTYRQSVVEFKHLIGTSHVRGYGFDEPWEVVRGTWTLEIWDGDRKLLEESFNIK